MNGAEWFLYLILWRGGPQIADGPYTETECMACGEAWMKRSGDFVRQNPKLYPRLPFTARSWGCFPYYPEMDPPVQLTFPNQPKLCKKKQ